MPQGSITDNALVAGKSMEYVIPRLCVKNALKKVIPIWNRTKNNNLKTAQPLDERFTPNYHSLSTKRRLQNFQVKFGVYRETGKQFFHSVQGFGLCRPVNEVLGLALFGRVLGVRRLACAF